MKNLRCPSQWYVIMCAICLSFVPAASARFHVADLGTIGTGAAPATWGYGINNAGMVVGYFVSPWHAFRDTGLMFDLGTLGGATSTAYGINNTAQIGRAHV